MSGKSARSTKMRLIHTLPIASEAGTISRSGCPPKERSPDEECKEKISRSNLPIRRKIVTPATSLARINDFGLPGSVVRVQRSSVRPTRNPRTPLPTSGVVPLRAAERMSCGL
jgi:hypothetical protein